MGIWFGSLSRRLRARRPALVLAVAGMVLGGPVQARADVWGFVDPQGVAHFATEQVDARYELFFRSAESFDTRLDPPPPERVVTQPVAPEPPPPPSKLLAFFDSSPSYKSVRQILQDASSDHNIDYELLQALIATESGFDTRAVSPKGAVGLMQIIPATAERYGVSGDAKTPVQKKLTDPRTNIRLGARYLRDLSRLFPNEQPLVLAAYNAGQGAVQQHRNTIPPYPETLNYVQVVTQFLQLYQTGLVRPKAAPAIFTRSAAGGQRIYMILPGRRDIPVPPADR